MAGLVLIGTVAAALGAGLALLHLNVAGLPSTDGLLEVTPANAAIFYAANGTELARLYEENRVIVSWDDIPSDMVAAVVSVEDRKFWSHWGVDLFGVARAVAVDLVARRVVQGASTITQQLARTLFLTHEVTVTRKLKEALVALRIERAFSKEEIMTLYLNQVYFGDGAHGIQAAAEVFLGKDARDLTLGECALLAGMIKNPRRYSPRRNMEGALGRRNVVLRLMRENNAITPAEESMARAESIEVADRRPSYRMAPYFAEQVRLQVEEKYGSESLYRDGLRVYTTLDPEIQQAAEEALLAGLEKRESLLPGLEETLAELDSAEAAETFLQGALVALEPSTGYVRAMVGGRDFYQSNWNRCVQARRQPGSSFKLFVYTAALESGYHTGSILYDRPLTLLTADDQLYVPTNYEEEFGGPVSVRQAIAQSINIPAVSLLLEIGGERVVECARRMGITSPLRPYPSLALGSFEVTLLEMTSAYAVPANGGVRAEPLLVLRVEDRDGRILERNSPELKKSLTPEIAYIVDDLLTTVVREGTGRGARRLGLDGPAAGKTGTTNDYTDAWFVGYVPGLAAGVWVGFDRKLSMGEKQSGGVVALPIWTEFMKTAKKALPLPGIAPPPPGGLAEVAVCTVTGFKAAPLCPRDDVQIELVPAEFVDSPLCPFHLPVKVETPPELPGLPRRLETFRSRDPG